MIARFVGEGFKEVRSARTQRAVGVSLERANAKRRAAKGVPDTYFRLIIHLVDQRGGINARRQFAGLLQFSIGRDVSVVRIHVLYASHSQRGGILQRAPHRP